MLISMEHGSSKSQTQGVTADIPTCGIYLGKWSACALALSVLYLEVCFTRQNDHKVSLTVLMFQFSEQDWRLCSLNLLVFRVLLW